VHLIVTETIESLQVDKKIMKNYPDNSIILDTVNMIVSETVASSPPDKRTIKVIEALSKKNNIIRRKKIGKQKYIYKGRNKLRSQVNIFQSFPKSQKRRKSFTKICNLNRNINNEENKFSDKDNSFKVAVEFRDDFNCLRGDAVMDLRDEASMSTVTSKLTTELNLVDNCTTLSLPNQSMREESIIEKENNHATKSKISIAGKLAYTEADKYPVGNAMLIIDELNRTMALAESISTQIPFPIEKMGQLLEQTKTEGIPSSLVIRLFKDSFTDVSLKLEKVDEFDDLSDSLQTKIFSSSSSLGNHNLEENLERYSVDIVDGYSYTSKILPEENVYEVSFHVSSADQKESLTEDDEYSYSFQGCSINNSFEEFEDNVEIHFPSLRRIVNRFLNRLRSLKKVDISKKEALLCCIVRIIVFSTLPCRNEKDFEMNNIIAAGDRSKGLLLVDIRNDIYLENENNSSILYSIDNITQNVMNDIENAMDCLVTLAFPDDCGLVGSYGSSNASTICEDYEPFAVDDDLISFLLTYDNFIELEKKKLFASSCISYAIDLTKKSSYQSCYFFEKEDGDVSHNFPLNDNDSQFELQYDYVNKICDALRLVGGGLKNDPLYNEMEEVQNQSLKVSFALSYNYENKTFKALNSGNECVRNVLLHNEEERNSNNIIRFQVFKNGLTTIDVILSETQSDLNSEIENEEEMLEIDQTYDNNLLKDCDLNNENENILQSLSYTKNVIFDNDVENKCEIKDGARVCCEDKKMGIQSTDISIQFGIVKEMQSTVISEELIPDKETQSLVISVGMSLDKEIAHQCVQELAQFFETV